MPVAGHKTKAALDGAYVPGRYPSDVGTRSNAWDPSASLYNFRSSSLQRLRAALGFARVGGGTAKLLCKGDSTTVGYGTGMAPHLGSMPVYLATALASFGIPNAGSGWASPFNNEPAPSGPYDGRWSLSGFANGATTINYVQATTSGATATYTSDKAGTAVDIATFGISGGFTYKIDGGSAVTVTPNGNQSVQVISVTGLSNTTHTVLITTTSTTSTYVVGARVRGSVGLEITNGGVGGMQTNAWALTGFNYPQPVFNSLDTYHGELLSLGLNDVVSSVSALAFKTNLQIIASADQALRDVILWVPPTPNSGDVATTSWTPYRSPYYDVADALNLPLIDLGDRFGSWATANTNGIMFDHLHPNGAGYAAIAQMFASLLGAR